MADKIIKKEVVVDNVTLRVTLSIPEDGGVEKYKYTVESVTAKDSKVDIQQLLSDEQYEVIHVWFEKNMNEEVSYDIHYEGRDLKAYGMWTVNQHFFDDIPDFELTRVTKPDSNRNLLRYMDDLDYPYLCQLAQDAYERQVSN
jgi:hypothetical protein